MHALYDWVLAHQAGAYLILSALLTLAAKPRSPEAYAKIAKVSPYLAKTLILAAALGPDLVKVAALLHTPSTIKDTDEK